MTFTELWNRMVAVVAAMPPAQALERLAVAAAGLVMGGWFLIDGVPHPLWLLPFGLASVGSMATCFELLLRALDNDNFDDGQDGEDGDQSGWELSA